MRDELKNWTNVEFTKKDGTIRKMICTTNLDLIPVEKHPKGTGESKPVDNSDPIYRVFERDSGWKSFRESQIILPDVCLERIDK